MAVLIQSMVDARVAGVLFTINPLSGSWRELPVEAVWGLGERLVGGTLAPDRYLLERPRKLWFYNKSVLSVLSESIVPQTTEQRAGSDKAYSCEAPLARKLTREDLLKLGKLGLSVEAMLSAPQDIEWAQDRAGAFWILQSRPITTQSRPPRGGATLWTRRFFGERFPGGVSVLSWSILEPILEWFIAYPEVSSRYLGGDPPLRRVNGHPYLNATVFRHLAFKLPGRPPPQFMLEFFPPKEADFYLKIPALPPDFRVYGAIFYTTFQERRWERFRWNPFKNHRAWADFLARLDERLALLERAPPALALEVGRPLIRDYIKIHITSLLFANLYYQLVAAFLSLEEQELLLRPPAGTMTIAVNHHLWLLAHKKLALSEFLARHGHRSLASWEIFAPRWAENPGQVEELSRFWLGKEDPQLAVKKEDQQSKAALEKLSSRPLKAAILLAQAYLSLREEQRYHFDRILWLLKQKLLGLGQSLEDPTDIRFLEAEELGSVEEWPAWISIRKKQRIDPDPPEFLYGDETLPEEVSRSPRLQGLGISPGQARGRCRVIEEISGLSALLPGEILVVRSTDPGWTPAFARAGGLILELGSLLSHGAVVAREFHLPAVANIQGATKRLKTGTEVLVDGRSGCVWVLDHKER
jgi:pyruvate,water dikinase